MATQPHPRLPARCDARFRFLPGAEASMARWEQATADQRGAAAARPLSATPAAKAASL